MFRLTYYRCVNSAGFRSGLGVKHVALDLSSPERIGKNTFIISGNNACGKSVLAESLHPFTTNTGVGRQRFFIDGKEGIILRDYVDDDGTEICTRMVYTPKSGGGHNTKCFFTIQRPGEDGATELNPTGNVSSYLNLVKTYFGITKDYVSFASYSEAVKGLVTQTSYERKNQISSLIPNTNRFEVAYATINEKYKTTRTLARNVAQKMVHLRDEETIRGDLNRCEKEIEETLGHREHAIKKIAEFKGKIQTLAGTDDIEELIDRYQNGHEEILNLASSATRLKTKLIRLCESCGINPENEEEITSFLGKKQRNVDKISRITYERDATKNELNSIRSQLNEIQNELSEAEATMYSLQTQDIDELKHDLQIMKARIDQMEYAKDPSKYSGMNYDEIVSFINSVDMIKSVITSLYEKYGQIFNDHFAGKQEKDKDAIAKELSSLVFQASDLEEKMNQIHNENADLYQYRRLQSILNHRPAECHIDTCPFIQDALKWPEIAKKIEANDVQYNELSNQYKAVADKIQNLQLVLSFSGDIGTLYALCEKNAAFFEKYLHLSVDKLYRSFGAGISLEDLNLDKLKRLAAILSEKELYERIIRVDIPEIENTIKLAKNAEASRAMIERRITALKKSKKSREKELDELQLSMEISDSVISRCRNMVDMINSVSDVWEEATEVTSKYDKLQEEYESLGETVQSIVDMMNQISEYQKDIDADDETMATLGPRRERLKYDLNQFNELTLEKALIEKDFVMLDIMRQIVAPGKGVWGECIGLYMDDVRATTNQLLLNMFNGNLYLDEFIITDKEFTIPYVYNGSRGDDVSIASSSQQAAISMALSLAIIAKMNGNYGVCIFDEADAPMSPANKEMFAEILIKQAKYIGLTQIFVVTHSPEIYSGYDVCRINFPGARKFEDDETIDILEGS